MRLHNSIPRCGLLLSLAVLILASGMASAQPHDHDHKHASDGKPVKRPRVFLDKSLRIVQYQLRRLDNERLLLVERKTDDLKYVPVYTAILIRAGMSRQYREEALEGLVALKKSAAASELLSALEKLDSADRQQLRIGRQLAAMLLDQPAKTLAANTKSLLAATESDNQLMRSTGYAGLIVAGEIDPAWQRATSSAAATLDWLAAVPLVPAASKRSALRDSIIGLLADSQPAEIRRAAIIAMASVESRRNETFKLIAPFVSHEKFRIAAIQTLLKIPSKQRDPAICGELTDVIARRAESTPTAQRTTDDFLDAMQLVDQLMAKISVDAARSYRARLREITVRVVRIHTIEEEMRYDTEFFAVEAGRPVQVVLKNEDLMPHNLVITVNGALQEVAELGMILGPNPGFQGKFYVPKSEKVLFATGMVQSRGQARLTFTAPSEPGEYPFVCTFPRHWMRMYGVMVVVPDLDVWLQNPIKPKDPIGSNRSFVKAWTIDDFKNQLETGLRGRTPKIGQRLFAEATCAQCHKVQGGGGAVGPELDDVFKRWKGDSLAVLREMLDPSHRIDPKYAVQVVMTDDGKIYTGIVQAEDKTSISILDNPEAKQPRVIQRSEIDEILKTSTSMMPKALLDRFSKDEVQEILAFLRGLEKTKAE